MKKLVHCSIVLLFSLSLLSGFTLGQENAQATFNMLGVTGSVTFIARGENTQAVIALSVSKAYTWEIREFPVIVAQRDPCNDTLVGSLLYNLTGSLSSINNSTAQNESVTLNGVSMFAGDSPIVGRTLMLISGDERVCASILPIAHQVSYAVVSGYVAGHIHVHKVGDRYAVISDLFSTQSLTGSDYSVSVYKGSVKADLPGAVAPPPSNAERCSNVSDTQKIADLPSVFIAGAGQRSRSISYITPTEVNDTFNFSSGYVKIENPEASCANFHSYSEKTVEAIFSVQGVRGSIKLSQPNPYKPTKLDVSLQGLNKTAGGYHVHLFPIGYKYNTKSDLCGVSVTGGHFSPFPVSDGLTQDYAEVGDLSRKHGSLAGLDSLLMSYEDWYLPLFGEYSVVGRSIVIHNNDESGSRWVCANIGYPGPVTTAVARFDFFAEGTVTFIQEKDKPWADTTYFINIAQAGFNGAESLKHNYHIHMTPVGADVNSTESRCVSTSGHWNPFSAKILDDSVYQKACTTTNKLGCEVGDTSAKFGTMDLAQSDKVNRYFYTDTNVALSGAYTILGRSVTIHEQNRLPGRYACADITEQLSVTAVMTSPDNGYIRFSESSIPGVSQVEVSLQNLQKIAGGYHIHETTLNSANPGENICLTTGGHFNPYNILSWTDNETADGYEVGDLSSKMVPLNSRNSLSITELDTNLPLRGNNSILGRSVVIHKAVDNGRWKCYNVDYDTDAMEATLIQGMATFNGAIDGRILLTQAVNEDGVGDVTIDVLLSYQDGKAVTTNHNWHVHVDTYDGSSCQSVGGHYNPFGADVENTDYARLCAPGSAQKCEMGDLSGKLGRVDVGGESSHRIFNDNFLTLVGNYSVVGRSIVVHDSEAGAGRLDCADIVPYGKSYKFKEMNIRRPEGAYRDHMAAVIANQLAVPSRSVYVAEIGQTGDGCTPVRVYFTGLDAEDLSEAFDSSNLGAYSSVAECNAGVPAAAIHLWLIIASAMLTVFLIHINCAAV